VPVVDDSATVRQVMRAILQTPKTTDTKPRTLKEWIIRKLTEIFELNEPCGITRS